MIRSDTIVNSVHDCNIAFLQGKKVSLFAYITIYLHLVVPVQKSSVFDSNIYNVAGHANRITSMVKRYW
jgi:hypothetical protein